MSPILDAVARLPRLRLAKLPTPLDEMANLSKALGGPRLLVKRDDLTGLATGGNKTRKLEFLIADAIDKGCDTVITAGGPQSNHCRQTAAAAAVARLECHLVLGGEAQPPLGNLLLDELLGATIHWVPKRERNARMESLADELCAAGRRPYVIPVGGSTSLGAVGYVVAMRELVEQLAARNERVDHLLFATSSGGTQAGIVVGARLAGFNGKITAISIDQVPDADSDEKFLAGVCEIANGTKALLERVLKSGATGSVSAGVGTARALAEPVAPEIHFGTAALLGSAERLTVDDFGMNYDYLGAGYGVVGDLEREAIKLFARTEGILVGPVYTGRAAGAMLDMIRRRVFSPSETVLFWHTGDETALQAYARELR